MKTQINRKAVASVLVFPEETTQPRCGFTMTFKAL